MHDTTATSILSQMKRLVLVATVVLLAVPVSRAAIRPTAPDDGTLSVRDGKGIVQLEVRGSIVGRFTNGRIWVTEPDPTKEEIVRGQETERDLTDEKTVYIGRNVRFRLVGTSFKIRISATGVDLSAVGRGTVILNAHDRALDPGEYARDGGPYLPLPYVKTTFRLGAGGTG